MDTRIKFLYRHFSNREIRELTGIPTRRVRAIREGRSDFTAKEFNTSINKYASIQYHRLRDAGLNKHDAQNYKKNNPGYVREVMTKNMHYARLITRSEILRLKESNVERKRRGEDLILIPSFKEKLIGILEGMADSDVDFDDREDWEKYGETK